MLHCNNKIFDYVDSFQGEFFDNNQNIGLNDFANCFFTNSPKWVGILFSFRNNIVRIFGLKTSGKRINI
ncbi:hypothetical protein BH11BAC5_BH11BAC5_50010 [soil metagenome]